VVAIRRVILIILLLTIFTQQAQSIVNDPYRPRYAFSDEVFKYLPPMPKDFYEIKRLYATQNLKDYDRLTPEYYLQPEFYPGWFNIANKTYCRDPRIHGKFGASFYPSNADITIEQGLEFTLTTLLYTSPGVESYQGTVIEMEYNKSIISVSILEPNRTEVPNYNGDEFFLLLEPTYPYFSPNWAKKFKIRIVALKEGHTELIIKNARPPEEIDKYYRDLYGYNYTSSGTFFGMFLPAFKADIVVTSKSTSTFHFNISHREYFPVIVAVVSAIVIALIITVKLKSKKTFKEDYRDVV